MAGAAEDSADLGAASDPSVAAGASPRAPVDSLSRAVEDLAGEFALRPLLRRVLRHAMSLLGAGASWISTVDERAGTYRDEAAVGVGYQEGTVRPLAEGLPGAVVAHRGPLVFDSYPELSGTPTDSAARERLHATAVVPIEWRNTIVALCGVASTDPTTRFGAEDVERLTTLTRHAAIAIANTHLHREAEERVRQLAVSTERERAMRDVHDTVARALGSILLHLDAMKVPDQAPRVAAARAAASAALMETRRTVLGLGPAPLDRQPFDEAIAAELGWVRSTAGVRTDLVVTGDRPRLPPDVSSDALRLVQEALTNVVAHAGAVLIRVGVLYGAEEVLVVVEDDGRGFDPADSTVRRTGRGLTGIVTRAQRLGADLQIDSTPGWGTRVRLRIPYVPSGCAGRAGTATPWRVLVVDPRPVIRAGLVGLLTRAEPEIQIVGEIGHARDVVAAVRALQPHVVLLDLRMPGVDGARLTSAVRSASPVTAVLVMTDDLDDELLREAVQAGARGCVGSDLDGSGLVAAVLAATRGDEMLTERVLRRFADRGHPRPDALTDREREVRSLVERGLPDKRIATVLRISVKTVEKHVGAVLRKTGAPNRTALAHRAARYRGEPKRSECGESLPGDGENPG